VEKLPDLFFLPSFLMPSSINSVSLSCFGEAILNCFPDNLNMLSSNKVIF
jgi:hypothetical protein